MKDVSIFGHLKGSSVAVVFAQLFGSLIVKRQWSTYSWLTTAWLFFVVTQKMVCSRKKQRENHGDSEDFHILAKVQRPQGKTGKRKEKERVEKQSSTALFGAT